MNKISVIIPVYNSERYLRRCIESIIRQTYTNYELICIDDCSTDNSLKILEGYQEKYPLIVKIFKNDWNIGQGKTRERGIACANGDFIFFIDSDDYIKPDYFQTYIDALACNPSCDIIVGGFIRDLNGKLTVNEVSNSIWTYVTHATVWARMFRRDFVIKNKLEFTKIKYGEDIYFTLSAFYAGAVYRVIPYCGYYYYYNSGSTTGSINYKENHERYISNIFDRFLERHDISKLSVEAQRAIEYTYIAYMVNALIPYGHGAGLKCMKRKYEYVMEGLKRKFPDYIHNPYYGIFKPKGQTLKIRLGVGITMWLHKIHLDKIMFYVVSLIK